MRKIKFVYWMCLMWVCASTTWAQTVSDSLSVKEPIRSEVSVDTLSLSVSDSLGLSAADTLVLSATDTLNLSDADTLVADTAKVGAKVRKRRPELPDWMKPYFVLKLMRDKSTGKYKLDTVSVAYERLLGVLEYLNDPTTPERYLTYDADYYLLFMPFTYYKRPIRRLSELHWSFDEGLDSLRAPEPEFLSIEMAPFRRMENESKRVDKTLLVAYINRMDRVVCTEDQLEDVQIFQDKITKEKKPRSSVLKLFASESMKYVKPDDEAEVIIHKPNWWVTGGSGSLQFAQNHISDNWYNGGESTHSLLGNLQLYANYNDREKWHWENLLDAKLGVISAPSDEYHNYLINNDQLRIASKLGLQAVNRWYYTLTTEFKTQFCNGYGANSQTMSAAFLSPADWTTGIGMDYKLNKSKVTLSVQLLPLTYTMKIVTNPEVDETALGLEEGHTTKHDFGSQVKANLTWNIFSFVTVTSRFDYLTSYETVRIEWENTFKFILNRYLSATLYVYGRYDDGVAPAENGSYFQINENLGFGLNYTW